MLRWNLQAWTLQTCELYITIRGHPSCNVKFVNYYYQYQLLKDGKWNPRTFQKTHEDSLPIAIFFVWIFCFQMWSAEKQQFSMLKYEAKVGKKATWAGNHLETYYACLPSTKTGESFDPSISEGLTINTILMMICLYQSVSNWCPIKTYKTSWWFQPIWKILVKMEIFPK